MSCDLVLVMKKENLETFALNYDYLKKNLTFEKIVVIGEKNLKDDILSISSKIKFIDENLVYKNLSKNNINNILQSRNKLSGYRSGWYLQQFLKMSYAFICESDNYLIWDADTIPLNKINMFDEMDKMIFDVKSEYHLPYFSTLKKILDITKKIDSSYISEHMIISKEIMQNIILEIENNNNLIGNNFFEKILFAIRLVDIDSSGFSEFETYGNYVETKYAGLYSYRRIKSLRHGKRIFGANPKTEMLSWASESYDTIAFESWDVEDTEISNNLINIMQKYSLEEYVQLKGFC